MIETSSDIANNELGLKHKYLLSSNPNAPLVILIHGRAGDFDVMWTFKRCISEDHSIISVQAPIVDPIGGYSWWDINSDNKNQQREESLLKIVTFLSKLESFYGLNPNKLVGVGFSQGGGVLSLLGQREPELFNSLAILASFVIESDREISSHSLPKIFIYHGTQDQIIPIAKAEQGSHYLSAKGYEVQFYTEGVGHKVGVVGIRELKSWLSMQ